MCKRFLGIILLALLFMQSAAHAQCTGGLINACPAAVSPQPGDLALTWQNGQSPHTRAMSLSQVVNGALVNRLTTKLSTPLSATSGAGLNVGVGTSPTACVSGDIWETGNGLFSCVSGNPVGPYGTGGSVLPVYPNSAALPVVTTANAGNFAFVSNCLNGSQSGGSGTGCPYVVNNAGAWTALPSPPSQPITVGGQALFAGGSSTNQGNGSLILTCAGSFVTGNAITTNSNGACVDSGTPPSGGTGGGGTVANSTNANAIPFYPAAGSTVAPLSVVNNAVLITSPSGVPSEGTTLPAALTIPAPTISGPTITGTTSQSTTNLTGKLTTAASGSIAGFNLQPGTLPTSLSNGDLWDTTTGVFARVNGSTQGPFLWDVLTTSPLGGGGAGPALTLTCTTCATTTNGGALTATSPIAISAAGVISLGVQPNSAVWIADSATVVHNDTYNLIEKWYPTISGTIQNIVYHTGGTSTPTFNVSLQIAGTPVTGCNGLGVSSSSDTTSTCTAANTIANGQALSLVISGVSGSPASAVVQVNFSKPAS